jgi:hypothetical protein
MGAQEFAGTRGPEFPVARVPGTEFPERVRHTFTYKKEGEALRGRGDTAQNYIQNGS